MESRKHLEYIDSVKALSMLMIMFGHITDLANPVDTWMSSCKICVFYVISGFLMAYTNGLHKRTPLQFVKNITANIAWPYLTFSVIAILVKCFYTFSKHKGMAAVAHTFRDNLGKTLFLSGINSMWFLPTLFFGELIILLLFLAPKFIRVLYAVFGLLAFRGAIWLTGALESSGMSERLIEHLGYTVNMMGKSFIAAWFIGLGYILFLLMKKYDLLDGRHVVKLAAGLILTTVNVVLSQMNLHVDFNMMTMGDRPFLFLFGGIFGSLGLILLFDAITSRVSLSGFNYWGRNSLILMCTHTALGFKGIAYAGWAKVAHIPEEAGLEYIIECFCVLIILMFIMYGVTEFINKYFPWLAKFRSRRQRSSKAQAA